jgi:hypothetical protein
LNGNFVLTEFQVFTVPEPPARPVVTGQPQGATLTAGTNLTFTASATSTPSLGYQWPFNGTSILGVTNPPAEVVANPAGVSLGLYPGITVRGAVGLSYTIQSTTDLTNTNSWSTAAILTLMQPEQLWVDVRVNTTSPTNRQPFYRVLPGP